MQSTPAATVPSILHIINTNKPTKKKENEKSPGHSVQSGTIRAAIAVLVLFYIAFLFVQFVFLSLNIPHVKCVILVEAGRRLATVACVWNISAFVSILNANEESALWLYLMRLISIMAHNSVKQWLRLLALLSMLATK